MPLEARRAYSLRLIFETTGALLTDLTVDHARFR